MPTDLDELLHHVEDRCNRAVAVINTVARGIEGDDLNMLGHSQENEDVQRTIGAALERIAEELTGVSDRALKARVAGGAV